MLYPIGTQTFSTLIEENLVYVDKTDLVYALARKRICFLCRPRRFGKSLLLSTLASYFRGEKDLFRGLKIEALEKEWKQYPVLHLDFAQGNYKNPDYILERMDAWLNEWESLYGVSKQSKMPGIRFGNIIKAAHEKTGQKVVVLVDEYDKPLLDVLSEPAEETNRDMLKEIYSTFKAVDAHLRFVLLTGVTKFSQVSVFSGFNQPKDISMDNQFEALCGITEEELHTYFEEEITAMAPKYGTDREGIFQLFKKRYDGYHFSEGMLDIYNPFSVLNALDSQRMEDYWFASGTPTYLMKLIDRDKVDMQALTSRYYEKQYFIDYKADREDPLAMIYQSGYLTVKDVDYSEYGTQFLLDFPNGEVRKGFVSLLANDYFHQNGESTPLAISMTKMLREARLGDLRDTLTAFFASIPYDANRYGRAWSYESHYHYTLYLIFRLLSCYTTFTEKQNAKGRADIIVETPKYVYIFEFKLDGTAQEALDQIEKKGYAIPYAADPRPLYRIGVSFSSTERNITDWVEID